MDLKAMNGDGSMALYQDGEEWTLFIGEKVDAFSDYLDRRYGGAMDLVGEDDGEQD